MAPDAKLGAFCPNLSGIRMLTSEQVLELTGEKESFSKFGQSVDFEQEEANCHSQYEKL